MTKLLQQVFTHFPDHVLRSHHELQDLFQSIVAAESPPANLHFKFVTLLFDGVALFLASEIEELLVAELVDVLGSRNIDSKFVYGESQIKVYPFQESVNILDIPLALEEGLEFLLCLRFFFILVEVQLSEVLHQLFLVELLLISHNTCVISFGVHIMEEHSSSNIVKWHHEL